MYRAIFLLLLICMMPAWATPIAESPGYLLGLRIQGEHISLERISALPRFEPMTPLPDAESWRVEVQGVADKSLWSSEIPSPQMLAKGMPHGAPLLMSFRIPAPAEEGLLRVRDAQGEVRYSLYLDAKVAETARREREEFLAWLRNTPKAQEMDEAEQAKAQDYIKRQQAIAAKREQQEISERERCIAQGMQLIPELAGTNQPCLPLRTHEHEHAHDHKLHEHGLHAHPAHGMEISANAAAMAKPGAETAAPENATSAPQAAKAKVQLNGRVLGEDGSVIGTRVRVRVVDGINSIMLETDAQGRFTVEVEAGYAFDVMVYPTLPWLSATFTNEGIQTVTSREFRINRGIVLSGKLKLSSEALASGGYSFYSSYEEDGKYLFDSAVIQRNGDYKIPLPKNKVATLYFNLPDPYIDDVLQVGPYSVDSTRDFTPDIGVRFVGRLKSDSGEVLINPSVTMYATTASHSGSPHVGGDGRFEILLRGGHEYVFQGKASKHIDSIFYMNVPSADFQQEIVLEKGVMLSGRVLERSGGDVVQGGQMRVYDENQNILQFGEITGAGYAVTLKKNAANIIEFGRWGEVWPAPILVNTGTRDITRTLYLPPRHNVSIAFKTQSDEPIYRGRVEIWQGDKFVIAATSDHQGLAKVGLPAGRYTAKARPGQLGVTGIDYYGLHLYGHDLVTRSFTVAGETTLDMKIGQDKLAQMKLESGWYSGFLHGGGGRYFELLSGGRVVATSTGWGEYEYSDGKSRWSASMHLPSGRSYRLRVHVPGSEPVTSRAFTARADGVVRVNMPSPQKGLRWKGRLFTAANRPAVHVPVEVYWRNYSRIYWGGTGSDGSFDLPACSGCFYRFHAPVEGNAIAHTETLQNVTASFRRNVQLERLSFRTQRVREHHLQRLWGPASGERHDILFLGDGYTARNETFTDRNGNGVWDGVLYHDLNQNGVWDNDEPYVQYGNAERPVEGRDPSRNNEPFNDRNGDGMPNIAEAQLFFAAAKNYLRAIFGADYWSERRNLFRAWTYLVYSEQAGSTVFVPNVGEIVVRNTLFNSRYETGRRLVDIDYMRAAQLAAEVMPEADTIVVLLNQSVPVGRANSFVVDHGSLGSMSPNTYVAAHELGHNVGGLDDEYSEFIGAYTGATPGRHMSRSLDKRLARWRDFLPADYDSKKPTLPNMPGNGLFEGGSYMSSGVYRSTHDSMMRGGAPKFSDIQRLQMDERFLKGRELLRIPAVNQCDGSGRARVQLRWDVRGLDVKRIQIRSGSMDGPVFTESATRNGNKRTTQRVVNGSLYFLFNADNGALLDMAKVEVTQQGC